MKNRKYKVSFRTYQDFIKENHTDKLSPYERIYSGDSLPNGINLPILNEIFDSKVDKLDYREDSYDGNYQKNWTYYFDSKNGNHYRLDMVVLIEDNDILKDARLHNKIFISISFSLADANLENYDDETSFDEIYDLMSRIKYLIDIHKNKITDNYVFMFGQPERDEKIDLYKYFIKICFPDYRLIKDRTTHFSKTNIGYYLIEK